MTSIRRSSLVLLLSIGTAVAASAACAPPHRDVAAADVPKLTSLSDLMDVQATIADPQFKKVGDEAKYTDADYAAFEEVSNRILATSLKAKEFSKGNADFDRLCDALHDRAEKLGAAAKAKNGKGASDALAEMKKVCKECHSKHR
ncbi:MAG: cytochrome c [Deltaproteobacteria bacterium]|nr:cytochrome c [Deltaproteobacteria bacterium]